MKHCYGAFALALGLIGSTVSASASETGLASMHTWRKVGGKTCMADHYHTGNGSGTTRALAEKSAISSWADFTALEYGSSWASFKLAAGKQMNCTGSGTSWQCTINALPCRGK